jgi:Fur family peroxide stress response transcriptional regulator
MDTNKIFRETRQKKAILEYLKCTRSHPTADEIYETVRKQIPRISKGTVYRNLQVLSESGRVTVLDLCGHVARYDARRDAHDHFRCRGCGRVIDLDEPVDPGLEDRISKRTGFVVSGHQTEFRGWCAECRRPSQDNQKET